MMDQIEDGKALDGNHPGNPDVIGGWTYRKAVAAAQSLLEGFLVILQQVGHLGGASEIGRSSMPNSILLEMHELDIHP